jgi:hypothetical protein
MKRRIFCVLAMLASVAGSAWSASISWSNEAKGCLTVTNNVDANLVLFAGSLARQSIIGGIKKGPGQTRTFDIYDDVTAQNGSFLMRAVRESVYNKKKAKLTDDDVIFARLVTYNKQTRDIKTDIVIDQRLEGEAIIYFENNSNLVVEIRLDSPTGEKIATLPPFQRKKPITLADNKYGYTYFPTYVYYDEKQKDVRSITTQSLKNGRSESPVVPGSGDEVPFVRFGQPDTKNIFSPVASLIVENESDNGFLFCSGGTPLDSIRGRAMINSGGRDTYEIDMKQTVSREIGGFNIDWRDGELVPVGKAIYKAGNNYTLTIRRDGTMALTDNGPSNLNNLEIRLVDEN